MPDEEKKDVQNGTETEEQEVEVDFSEEVAKFEKKSEDARTGYERRKAGKGDGRDVNVADVDSIADQVAARLLPRLQATTESALFENKLDALTDDPAQRKLIRFHYENTVIPVGSIEDRLEIAFAAANRRKILKTSRELTTALKNRQQIQNNTQGNSSDASYMKVSDGQLAEAQIRELKTRGWSDQKIERFKKNLSKNSR